MTSHRFFFLALALLATLTLSGCRKPAEPEKNLASRESDGLTAQEILAGVLNAYALAPAYSDEGYLYLSYRMQGSLIQEQQPWKTKFQRPNRLAGDWYNSRIRCDGTRLGCYVFDNDTANLDNQWLVLDAAGKIPLTQLLADPMARHFVTGDSEIPLNISVLGTQMPLIPAVTGLLTGDQAWPVLTNPEIAVRLDDAMVDDRASYHLHLSAGKVAVECWFDMENFLLRQMTLPVELLDENVRTSPEISELRFFSRMHGCGFSEADSADPISAFEVTAPVGAKPVRHLITLPEEFPCEFVGKPSPVLDFQAGDGSRNVLVPEGNKTQVLIWLPGNIDGFTVSGVAAMIAESGNVDVRYVLNAEHLQPIADRRMMYPAVAKCLAPLRDKGRILIDPGLENLQKARLKNAASAIVIDPDKMVQYAVSLNDGQWPQKLSAAITRINAGDDIGREMQADYAQYLETYHRRLQMVAVNDSASPGTMAAEDESSLPLAARQIWSCDQVQKPGNLVVDDGGAIVAVDGWRSIVRLDLNGTVKESRKLEIPSGNSVNRIRKLGYEGKTVWALFSVMGQGVFLFDDAWNPAGTVSGDSQELDRVLDCQFRNVGVGEPILLVAFESSGVRQFKLDGTADGIISQMRCESIGISGPGVLGLRDGQVLAVADEPQPALKGNQVVTSFLPISAASAQPSGAENAVAITVGMNSSQIWTVKMLHPGLRDGLEGLAGPQLFDTQVEPLAGLESRGLCCSADSNGQVRVYDNRMKTLCQFRVPNFNGLAITESDGSVIICCSSGGSIIAWQLEASAARQSGERAE